MANESGNLIENACAPMNVFEALLGIVQVQSYIPRRRLVFLEVHWLAPMDCRVSNRIVADLAGSAMDG